VKINDPTIGHPVAALWVLTVLALIFAVLTGIIGRTMSGPGEAAVLPYSGP